MTNIDDIPGFHEFPNWEFITNIPSDQQAIYCLGLQILVQLHLPEFRHTQNPKFVLNAFHLEAYFWAKVRFTSHPCENGLVNMLISQNYGPSED